MNGTPSPPAPLPVRGRGETSSPIRRRRGPLLWLSIVIAVAMVALLAVAVLRPATDNPLMSFNRPAYDFTMSLYSGGKLHLKDLRGKTVVLNFWWSQCAPCVQEAPILERQWRAWKDKNVVFVGVDELDAPGSSAPRDFMRRFHVSYLNGPDPGDLSIQYGTTGQPETVFISPRGIFKNKYAMPFTDDETLARLIREARA